jgi:8-oxo-dGTP pyrophosphatase MutT (NUDIX family)
MPDLDRIRAALSAYGPQLKSAPRQAAVAMVLRGDPTALEVLFIERAEHPNDPWSGHMAFPGGRVDPGDSGPRAAAERETLEEVGLSLEGAERLGQLDDLEGRHAGRPAELVISGFVYHLAETPDLALNHEVREALWIPMHDLHAVDRHVEYRFPRYPEAMPPYPGIVVGDPVRHVVWGLTYRFLEVFYEIVGRPLADRWGTLRGSGSEGS